MPMAVSMVPGAITFTRISSCTSSTAAARASWLRPPFEATYGEKSGAATVPRAEPMWMMLPCPRSRMRGATVLVSTKAPTRLMRNTSAKSAAEISRRGERSRTAAEFTSTSTPPNSARAAPISRATSASLPTSPLTACAVPPALLIAATVSARGSGRRPKITTFAPSLAKSSAVARPMPVPPPATMATLPSSALPIVDAPAEGLHGTPWASGLPRRAPRGAEVHEGLIVVVGAAQWNERFGERPHGLLTLEARDPARAKEHPAEDAADIGVDQRGVLAVGEGQDRACRVASDARHAATGRAVRRQPAVIARYRLARDAVEAPGAPIVAERAPHARHLATLGARQILHGRIAREELAILGDDPIDLCLLEHDLGHEDAIRLSRPSPRQIAPVTRVPGEQAPLEDLPRRPVGKLHGGHCHREPWEAAS